MNRQTVLILMLALAAGAGIGYLLAPDSGGTGSVFPTTSPSAAGGEREILYWKAPMDPNYRRDRPGKSPMGMDLVPVYADEGVSDAGVVRIDPTVTANLGVRTAVAESGRLPRTINTVGHVAYDEYTQHHIHVRVEGWIEKLAVRASGDPVRKGQVLFEIYSPTLVNAQEEYLSALQSGSSALRNASNKRLDALGMTSADIERLKRERTVDQRVRVVAPHDGVVTHLGVREGIFITPMMDLMSIAGFDRIWVLAEVLERQAGWVAVGRPASVTLDAAPGRRWQGVVDYVLPELDPRTRTLQVRLRFDNPDGSLRPNMFARVAIDAPPTGTVVHVPRAAVIRSGSIDRVVVAEDAGRFRVQPVQIGIESGDRTEIASGLSAGDRVVVSGQFLIDSESNIGNALERMSDEAVNTKVGHPDDTSGHASGHEEGRTP